ncbi:unnamed protein product [Boreogadus saida]
MSTAQSPRQICINYKGYYKCECYEGYEMDPVSKTCKAVGSSPYLMFTNRHEIRRLDLRRRSSSEYTRVVSALKNAVALDVDVASGTVFWCDLYQRRIYSASISQAGDPSQQRTLVDSALQSPEGLAVDWVHGNIYWTDSGNKSISVAAADGRRRKVLVSTELSEPRSIAVDPRHGFLYWSDWGEKAKIEKAGMNGVDRQVLVSEHIEWPNGITLDLSNQRLYWVDSKLHLLSSVDLSGARRQVLLSSQQHLRHPFALSVFQDRVYWTDLEDQAIYSANRLTGQDLARVAEHLDNPLDLVVFHQQRQPPAPDTCNTGGLPNGGCEYLCLKAPQITDHSPKYTCACPDDMELGPDMRRCAPPGRRWSTTAPPRGTSAAPRTTPPATAAIGRDRTQLSITSTPTPTPTPTSTPTPKSTSTRAGTPRSTSTQTPPLGPAGGVQTDSNGSLSHRAGSELGLLGSHITVAVLAIAVPVALSLLCTSAFLLWRNWRRRRNTKSMNFDNPVYRKTTEEEDDDDDSEVHIGRHSEAVGHVYPAVSGSRSQPFHALPLGGGGGLTDSDSHWYSGAPMHPSGK